MAAFIGKTGEIIGREGGGEWLAYRVRLDRPVHVEGVGEVTDDFWEGELLRAVRVDCPALAKPAPARGAGWSWSHCPRTLSHSLFMLRGMVNITKP